MKKDSRIYKYIKTLITNKKYLTTEDIMLMLEKYYHLPIKVPSVFYKYKKLIKDIRQEVYKERRKNKIKNSKKDRSKEDERI
ncbi:MAG: hypothetical protein RXN80_02515 [Hydrogenobaculum sp.]|uniref:hypothetical protein n=1 Tax=unclassified Hydrogenobaculum TaxID=2622382 RepID=UPI0001C52806|nr:MULTISPECIES: hypothetical protein [unclassified Hydrogenobaculum]AEF18734.1 hypothetical protein Hyd3684_0328 [Hydrogenobaculum sp. 3684]